MTTEKTNAFPDSQRDEWLAHVQHLMDQLEVWSTSIGWSHDRSEKVINEQLLGTYSAPTLRIRTPAGEVRADPIARSIIGADGRVDLEAWPSLNRVKLVRRDGQWTIITDSNVPVRKPWAQDTFVELVNDLVSTS